MAASRTQAVLFAVLGLNRAGRILYLTLFIIAVPAAVAWFVLLPRVQFHDEDERLFRAARHGDVAGVEQAIAAGARVNVAAPIDGKTAVFRAAVFGHADVVRVLVKHGADVTKPGNDGRTALDVILAAAAEEHDASRKQALDGVVSTLRELGSSK